MHAPSKNPILLTLALMPLGISLAAMAAQQPRSSPDRAPRHSTPSQAGSSPLIDKVRAATSQFQDINAALSAGWVQGTPCVSGPNSGAMGVHFILPERVGDGVLNANEPEALIYEPQQGGAFRLVGVEFIVIASDWASNNPGGSPPSLDGHLTNYVGEPNRYGLPAFYE